MHPSFVRLWCFARSYLGSAILFTLAWSGVAVCGEIHDAVRNGDLAKVQRLLKNNPDLAFSKDDDGATPLHYAASDGYKEIAELLINSKANVNVKDNFGDTPLYYAVYKGHKELAELLLSNGADVNAKESDTGGTSLQQAAAKGYKEIAELLIAEGANVNSKDKSGETPLHDAASAGDVDLARLLLAHGADANARDDTGRTPLQVANVELVNERFAAIDQIVILPVVDARSDRKAKVDLESIRKNTAWILEKRKHYSAVPADSSPQGARWVLIITLNSLGGRVPAASVSASLCDNKESETSSVIALLDKTCASHGGDLWFGGAAGAYKFGPRYPNQPYGAAGQLADLTTVLLMPGSARKEAMENSLSSVLSSIPTMPKKKKK